MPLKTLEIDVDRYLLGNLAYARLSEIVEQEFGKTDTDICYVNEAKFLLAIEEALASKADYIVLHLKQKSKDDSED